MIHYHGAPTTPVTAAVALYKARHSCVSFANPEQLPLIADVCQSFILDNGAFSAWKQGGVIDIDAYAEWVREWRLHPAYDWCLMPDVIDGTEDDNRIMRASWIKRGPDLWKHSVPIWHLHESLQSLKEMVFSYRRIALGSSGEYADPDTERWWGRITEAMDVICDDNGRPRVRLHGLRMLAGSIIERLPLASADSTNVAINIGLDTRWTGAYTPATPSTRALVLAERIEMVQAATIWDRSWRPKQEGLF